MGLGSLTEDGGFGFGQRGQNSLRQLAVGILENEVAEALAGQVFGEVMSKKLKILGAHRSLLGTVSVF